MIFTQDPSFIKHTHTEKKIHARMWNTSVICMHARALIPPSPPGSFAKEKTLVDNYVCVSGCQEFVYETLLFKTPSYKGEVNQSTRRLTKQPVLATLLSDTLNASCLTVHSILFNFTEIHIFQKTFLVANLLHSPLRKTNNNCSQ